MEKELIEIGTFYVSKCTEEAELYNITSRDIEGFVQQIAGVKNLTLELASSGEYLKMVKAGSRVVVYLELTDEP